MVRALLIISGSNDNGYNSSSANTVVLVIIVHCDRDYSDNDWSSSYGSGMVVWTLSTLTMILMEVGMLIIVSVNNCVYRGLYWAQWTRLNLNNKLIIVVINNGSDIDIEGDDSSDNDRGV